MGRDQAGQGVGVEQRNITGGDYHHAVEFLRQRRQPAQRSMPGAQLFLLHGHLDRSAEPGAQIADHRGDAFAVLAQHHHQVFGADLGDRVQGVPQHASTGQGVQHLRGVRAHPGTCPAARTRTADSVAVVRAAVIAAPRVCGVVRDTPIGPCKSAQSRNSSCRWSLGRASLRRQDSNLNYLNQNQRCCRLHHDGSPSTDFSPSRPTLTLTAVAMPENQPRTPKARMTGSERRHQLINIARALFAERGYEGTSIEEIAQRAGVSKPVVYEHFGGKEGLYAVVVDREMSALLDGITSSLTNNRSRVRVERVALALLTYVEERTDGFRIMIRDSPASITSGTYSSLLNDAVSQVASILAGDFARRGLDPELAPLYAQAWWGRCR